MRKPTLPRNIRFQTRRLCIRPLKKSDFNCWLQAHLEMLPKQNEFDTAVKPQGKLTRANFLSWLKRVQALQSRDFIYVFGVFDKKTGMLVGNTHIELVTRLSQQSAWLAYNIYNNHRRKGYAAEAVRATIDFAFLRLKLHRLEAPILPRNKPSIALAKSIGMRRECLSRKRMHIDGRWEDLLIYVLLAEDWGIKNLRPVFTT